MSDTAGLAAFVTARLDEWEAAAKAAPGEHWQAFTEDSVAGASVYDEQWVLLYPQRYDHDNALSASPGATGPQYIEHSRDELAAHIALHDPASTLLLVASLREIVQRFVQLREYAARPYDAESTSVEGLAKRRGYLHALEVAIEGFAGIWSTHPEYQERWKP